MPQLIYINVRSSRCKLPNSIGRLSKLETLDCRVEAAEPIKISKLETLDCRVEGKSIKISKIETLDCRVEAAEPITIPDDVWKIPTLTHVHGNGLRCNFDVSHLVKLQTVGSLLLNSWIGKSIPNLNRLRKLNLFIEPEHKEKGDMINDSWKSLQKLPYLKVLCLNFNGYKDIEIACTKEGFPRLLSLKLVNCLFHLWRVEYGSMPYLEILQLESCPNFVRLPSSLLNRSTLPRLFYSKMGEKFDQWVKSCKVSDATTISGTHPLDVESQTLDVANLLRDNKRKIQEIKSLISKTEYPSSHEISVEEFGNPSILDVGSQALDVASNIDEGIEVVKEKAPPEIKKDEGGAKTAGHFSGEDRIGFVGSTAFRSQEEISSEHSQLSSVRALPHLISHHQTIRAMSDIAVNFAAQLLSFALDEIKLPPGVGNDMEWLLRELQMMRCFSLDTERRSLSGDEAVKNLVRDITDAAYEAENIAAKFARRERRSGLMATLQRYGFPSKELWDILNEIKRLKEKIVDFRHSRATYGISFIDSNAGGSSKNTISELRGKPLFQNKEHVIGLQFDKNRVMELLRAKENRRYVIGIVGMGGIGKTTLARQVFKDIDRREFPKTAWVDLSHNYIQNHSIHKLLYEIAKQVIPNPPSSESTRTEDLSELLRRNLKDERYIIVMDDMWETDVWDFIKGHLPDTDNGSRIIITTSKWNVANHPTLHFSLHCMEGLDDEHSWDLFSLLVFEDEEEIRWECIGELKYLAKELVNKCQGLPLALTVLGSLLAGKEKTYSAWRDVLGNKKLLGYDAGSNCLDIIKLSYRDLPHHLKLCFLYLSAFPENHKIKVEKLIRLWVAEGFVAETGSNNEEDIARTYLEDLKQRCLVMVFDSAPVDSLHGCYEYCRIHNLVRELSINEAKEVNFMNSEIKDGSNRVIYRLSLQDEFSSSTLLDLHDTSPSLRTLLNFTEVRITNLKHFNLLRVLDLEGAIIDHLPEEVGDMILLRYLSIRYTYCRSLPHSISKLSYLETLDCKQHLRGLVEIPDSVWKMKTLKHILGVTMVRQVDMSHLVKLHTLVGRIATPDFVHSLLYLTHLRVLSVAIDIGYWGNPIPLLMDIWRAMGSWPFLKFLHLWGFDMKDVVCDKHGFPRLQRLAMVELHFDSWEVEKGSMPSLECINIHCCSGLKQLPNGLAHCKKLRILHCSSMDREFVSWYENGKRDKNWEFHYVTSIQI